MLKSRTMAHEQLFSSCMAMLLAIGCSGKEQAVPDRPMQSTSESTTAAALQQASLPPLPANAPQLYSVFREIAVSGRVDSEVYRRYFESYPESFGQLVEYASDPFNPALHLWVVTGGDRVLIDWNAEFCKTYDVVGSENYMRKLVRLGVDAGDWGLRPSERGTLMPADEEALESAGVLIAPSIFRTLCVPGTVRGFQQLAQELAAQTKDLSDAEFARFYQSLGWSSEGNGHWDRHSLIADAICERTPRRCAVMTAMDQQLTYERPH